MARSTSAGNAIPQSALTAHWLVQYHRSEWLVSCNALRLWMHVISSIYQRPPQRRITIACRPQRNVTTKWPLQICLLTYSFHLITMEVQRLGAKPQTNYVAHGITTQQLMVKESITTHQVTKIKQLLKIMATACVTPSAVPNMPSKVYGKRLGRVISTNIDVGYFHRHRPSMKLPAHRIINAAALR